MEYVLTGFLMSVIATGCIAWYERERRSGPDGAPSVAAWDVELVGAGRPYPSAPQGGVLHVGPDLVWVAGGRSGTIDLTATGLRILRVRAGPHDGQAVVVGADGRGTVVEMSVSPESVDAVVAALSARPLPPAPRPPGTRPATGHVLAGSPLVLGGAGALSFAAVVLLELLPGTAPDAVLDALALMFFTGSVVLVLAVPVAGLLKVRARRRRAADCIRPAAVVPADLLALRTGLAPRLPLTSDDLSAPAVCAVARQRATEQDWQAFGRPRPSRVSWGWWQFAWPVLTLTCVVALPVLGGGLLLADVVPPAALLAGQVCVLAVATVWVLAVVLRDVREDRRLRRSVARSVPYAATLDDTASSVLVVADGRNPTWFAMDLGHDERALLDPAGWLTVHGPLRDGGTVVVAAGGRTLRPHSPLRALRPEDVVALVAPPRLSPAADATRR